MKKTIIILSVLTATIIGFLGCNVEDDPVENFKSCTCYFYGYGVSQDYDKALDYFFKGAELKDTSAMLHLMKCYNEGLGVKIDPDKAEYYRKKVFGKNRHSED